MNSSNSKFSEHEPVAYIDMEQWPPIRFKEDLVRSDISSFDTRPLYLHKKQFVGLSDKVKLHYIKLSEKMSVLDLIEAIEFELREKNT